MNSVIKMTNEPMSPGINSSLLAEAVLVLTACIINNMLDSSRQKC